MVLSLRETRGCCEPVAHDPVRAGIAHLRPREDRAAQAARLRAAGAESKGGAGRRGGTQEGAAEQTAGPGAGGAREGHVALVSTPRPHPSLSGYFFVSMHSWGLPHHPTLSLPIQNKVSVYLMVMADARGIWQRQKRSLSLSNIAPYVV